MRRVWIAQCLCPARHAIVAMSGEAEDEVAAAAISQATREQVERMLNSGAINPWCGLCGAASETWRYELGRTRFTTMAEAAPDLRANEAEQAVTRAVLGRY